MADPTTDSPFYTVGRAHDVMVATVDNPVNPLGPPTRCALRRWGRMVVVTEMRTVNRGVSITDNMTGIVAVIRDHWPATTVIVEHYNRTGRDDDYALVKPFPPDAGAETVWLPLTYPQVAGMLQAAIKGSS